VGRASVGSRCATWATEGAVADRARVSGRGRGSGAVLYRPTLPAGGLISLMNTVDVSDALGIDVGSLAQDVARVAAADIKWTGRKSRLRDEAAVGLLLGALADGKALHAAARASGFSDTVVRTWLRYGAYPGATGPAARLWKATEAIRLARDPVTIKARRAAREAARAAVDAAVQAAALEAQRQEEVEGRAALDLAQRQQTLMDALEVLHQAYSVLGYPAPEAGRVQRHETFYAAQRVVDRALLALAPPQGTETYEQRERRYHEWRRLTLRPGEPEYAYERVRSCGFRVEGFAY
jgi:hypothetical protein